MVTATLSVTSDDKLEIASDLKRVHGITIDQSTIPDQIILERKQHFDGGDFKANYFTLLTPVVVKTGKQRTWRIPKDSDERIKIRDIFHQRTPDIAYFPTFVFDFPETVFLTDRGGIVDRFYRRTFQDILDFDGRGHTIEKDVVRRIRAPTPGPDDTWGT